MPRVSLPVGTGFGRKLRSLLDEKEITVTQLADELDVTPTAVHQWLSGKRSPEPGILLRIADKLGVSVAEFLDSDDKSLDEIIRTFNETKDHPELRKYFVRGLRLALQDFKDFKEAGKIKAVRWAVTMVAGWQAHELGLSGAAETVKQAVDEARQAGIPDAVVVVAPNQQAALEQESAKWASGADIKFVVQPQPSGVGDALSLARAHVHDEPFAVIFPDERPKVATDASDSPLCLQTLCGLYEKFLCSVVGVKQIGLAKSQAEEKYGIALEYVSGNEAGLIWIKSLIEKPSAKLASEAPKSIGSAPEGDLRAIGRYVLSPEIFRALDHTDVNDRTGRRELTDALDRLARLQGVAGHIYSGPWETYEREAEWREL